MATSKRPALRKNDRVMLSRVKSPIPAYDKKPFVGRDMVLTVSHITGTGAKRNPWGVVVTDGTHFWHLEPGDVTPAEEQIPVCTGCRQPAHASETDDAGYHPGCVPTGHSGQRHSAKKQLDNWLDSHGYHHAHARKQKTPHPYTMSSRLGHAVKSTKSISSIVDGDEIWQVRLPNGKIFVPEDADPSNPHRSWIYSRTAADIVARDEGGTVIKVTQGTRSRPLKGHVVKAVKPVPFSHRKCYACDAEAVGVRDRRQEGGMIESACARHADPTIPAYPACYICGGRIRPTSYDVDGTFVHKACHAEDSR